MIEAPSTQDRDDQGLVRHAPGVVNPNWPLCLEVEARQNGWSDAEIEDGEVPWIPLFDHVADRCSAYGEDECPCSPLVPCRSCEEWVHA